MLLLPEICQTTLDKMAQVGGATACSCDFCGRVSLCLPSSKGLLMWDDHFQQVSLCDCERSLFLNMTSHARRKLDNLAGFYIG
jgi:hypothetical protein